MSIDRDDPEAPPLPPAEEAHAPDAGDETTLAHRTSNIAGAALLRDGLSPSVVDMIVHEALQDYARLRTSAKQTRRFLLKRILFKAELRRRLRGIDPAPDPGPYLLDVLHTRAALDTLTPAARTALEMLFRDGKGYGEIAETLGMSVAGVRRLVGRAMKRLRKWRAGAAGE
ncbi:MAG TPA: sigma factor-like helix-turn-helix DNA-binding protein [Thermoanaerobaculia bacterium]